MNEKLVDTRYARRYSVLAAIMLGSIMGPIDASIVNVVLPTITQSFRVGISTAQWVPMIYLFTISSLLLFYGRLGDILGYKKVYLAGLAGFVIASGLCGLSPTIHWLIAFRAIQGLAAGMMMAVPYAIITASFPPTERGKALGINAISISAGLAIGPSLGGFITSLLGWRFVFLINVPIGITGLLWGRHIIPELKGQPGKIDMPGVVTAFISLFSVLLLVNRFQSLGLSYTTGILSLIAVIAGLSFLLIESKATQPMLNLSLFNNATFSFSNVSALFNFMSQYVMVFLTPFYLQRVLHYAPNNVGLIMTSFPLAVMVVAPFSGSLSDRMGTKTPACLGAGVCAISLFLMSQLSASARAADVVWRLTLFGLGTGMFQSPNNSAVMGSAPRPHLGTASGIMATVRNVGMVLGIATGGAVLYAFAPSYILQKATLESAEAAAFLSGLRYAYIAGAILTAIAAVTSLARSSK
ncbi:MAG: MFS transporter [Anaerolineae bacterium]|jgi:EmrB/QacA subfamily drug resistance transporter|nr:MFS transporter [Anaerolineae bacterium]MDH7474108.1 MFS transporter [Anaerolineae bacterium]